MRILRGPPDGIGHPHQGQHLQHARCARVSAAGPAMLAHRLGDLLADGHHRVQRSQRLLEDHARSARPGRPRRPLRSTSSRSSPSTRISPRAISATVGQKPQAARMPSSTCRTRTRRRYTPSRPARPRGPCRRRRQTIHGPPPIRTVQIAHLQRPASTARRSTLTDAVRSRTCQSVRAFESPTMKRSHPPSTTLRVRCCMIMIPVLETASGSPPASRTCRD